MKTLRAVADSFATGCYLQCTKARRPLDENPSTYLEEAFTHALQYESDYFTQSHSSSEYSASNHVASVGFPVAVYNFARPARLLKHRICCFVTIAPATTNSLDRLLSGVHVLLNTKC